MRVYLQAAEGLAAAHARDLVHRDFKPGNAVIDEEGRVRVLDFGLAREADREAETTQEPPTATAAVADVGLDAPLTQTGAVLGTARAHELATQARDAFTEGGPEGEDELAEVERWLAEHPWP